MPFAGANGPGPVVYYLPQPKGCKRLPRAKRVKLMLLRTPAEVKEFKNLRTSEQFRLFMEKMIVRYRSPKGLVELVADLVQQGYEPEVMIKYDMAGSYFRVDFLHKKRKHVIELDGKDHQGKIQKALDKRRDEILTKLGFHVTRILYPEVLALNGIETPAFVLPQLAQSRDEEQKSELICARVGCEKKLSGNYKKKFCSDSCRNKAWRADHVTVRKSDVLATNARSSNSEG